MLGLMQDWPLTVDKIADHSARWHSAREVVTRRVEDGQVERVAIPVGVRARLVETAGVVEPLRERRIVGAIKRVEQHAKSIAGSGGISARGRLLTRARQEAQGGLGSAAL